LKELFRKSTFDTMEPTVRQLSDPTDLRALAHPVRMSILEQLIVFGPLTATQLAERIDESPANCSWHLRKLAEHGFVEEAGDGTGRARPWRAASRGLSWNDQDTSGSARLAGEALTAMFVDREVARYAAARQWLGRDEAGWREAAGSSQGAMWVTEDELTEISEVLRQLVTKHLDRIDDPARRPPGSRLCTVMGWAVPAYHPDGRPVTAQDAPASSGVATTPTEDTEAARGDEPSSLSMGEAE
jgi:DNA-binding transcriptional ArsR family regulator